MQLPTTKAKQIQPTAIWQFQLTRKHAQRRRRTQNLTQQVSVGR
jgi:hypothetical protein